MSIIHFDFVLYHKLGKTMQVEDLLSRQCKGTPLFPPLNCITTLQSNLSLFKYYFSNT